MHFPAGAGIANMPDNGQLSALQLLLIQYFVSQQTTVRQCAIIQALLTCDRLSSADARATTIVRLQGKSWQVRGLQPMCMMPRQKSPVSLLPAQHSRASVESGPAERSYMQHNPKHCLSLSFQTHPRGVAASPAGQERQIGKGTCLIGQAAVVHDLADPGQLEIHPLPGAGRTALPTMLVLQHEAPL